MKTYNFNIVCERRSEQCFGLERIALIERMLFDHHVKKRHTEWLTKRNYIKARCELRGFFASHARTSHVQIKVRTHTCAHANSLVVALRTRTRTFLDTLYHTV